MKKLTFKTVEFIKSCAKVENMPFLKDDEGVLLPNIAVAGRSNVGKSSLLNHLFRSKDMVKTSQKPGKTQLLNFFRVDDLILFCDLPGYGYAQVKQNMQNQWQNMIEPYIEKTQHLRLVLLLLDIRRNPSDQDKQFLRWVQFHHKSLCLVLTKVDKVSKNERARNTKKIIESLEAKSMSFVHYSVTKNVGRKELIFELNQAMET